MALDEVIDEECYRKAKRSASARNNMMHKLDLVGGSEAADAIDVAGAMLGQLIRTPFEVPYGVTSRGV